MKVSSNAFNVAIAGVSSAIIGGFILTMVSTGCIYNHLFLPLFSTGISLFAGGILLGLFTFTLIEPEDPFDEQLLLNRVKQAITKGIDDHQL